MELIEHKGKHYIKSDTGYREVLATTDPKLGITDYRVSPVPNFCDLPQIPQSLIEYYAKYQPEEVELEYEVLSHYNNGETRNWVLELKLQNNEVVWVEPDNELNLATNKFYMERAMRSHESVEGKLYTREEVEELCRSIVCDSGDMRHEYPDGTTSHLDNDKVNKWLKENL